MHTLLSSLTSRDLAKLMVAHGLEAKRRAAQQRLRNLAAKAARAQSEMDALDRKIALLLGNDATAKRAVKSPASRRPSARLKSKRPAREGSLRACLADVIQKKGPAKARELATRALAAGYKTKSDLDVFVRATYLALSNNPEFARKNGKYGLRRGA